MWTWHGITHWLSSQQDQSGSEDSEKGHSWTWHVITHSLFSHDRDTVCCSEKGYCCICCEITHSLPNNKTSVVMMTMRSMINVSVLDTHFLLSHQFQNMVNEKDTVIVDMDHSLHMASTLISPFLVLLCQYHLLSLKISALWQILSWHYNLDTLCPFTFSLHIPYSI